MRGSKIIGLKFSVLAAKNFGARESSLMKLNFATWRAAR